MLAFVLRIFQRQVALPIKYRFGRSCLGFDVLVIYQWQMKNLFVWFCFTFILSSEFRDGVGVHESLIHWFGEGFELGLLWICCTLGHLKPVSFMWVRSLKYETGSSIEGSSEYVL